MLQVLAAVRGRKQRDCKHDGCKVKADEVSLQLSL